jgi:hypothetical protein
VKVATILLALAGCAGTARGLEAYRTDTQHLLETRNAKITSCYTEALKADTKAAGTVTVTFVVEKKTGKVTNAALDPAKTTAPQAVGRCVLDAVDGLVLDPPDRNEGRATVVYELEPKPS